MTWVTKIFIREINNIHLPLKTAQDRIRSIRNYTTIYNEKGKMNNEMQYARPTRDIPGPKALPLIGNLFRFMPLIGEYYNMNVLTLMRMLRDKYGNIVKLDGFAQRPCIFLFCPELCKSMYQLQGKWPIRISMESLLYYRKSRKDIYGGQYGLVISQGELWQKFRTKVNPHMLQPQIIKPHVVQICETVNDFVEYMRVLRDPKTLELSNDFMNELYKWSLETMFSIALDYRLGCLKPNLVMNSEPQIIINCVKEMFELLYRLENPSPWKATNMRNLKKLFQTSDIINEISNKYIKHAKTKFLETSDNTSLKDRSILMRLLCIDEQIAYVMVLDTLTSIDTTSNAAAALLYYVANNVKKQEKLREEVMSVLPSKTTPITHDMLERIPYTKACIKESLRMFPIASGVQRTIQRDVLIGGYIIPKESFIIACHGLFSMDPTYFPLPEEYIPERWLRNSPEFLLYGMSHPYAYLPFGFGARSCIGRKFVEMDLEILLLKIIRNFRIEWHYGPLEYKSEIINMVTSPLALKLIDV